MPKLDLSKLEETVKERKSQMIEESSKLGETRIAPKDGNFLHSIQEALHTRRQNETTTRMNAINKVSDAKLQKLNSGGTILATSQHVKEIGAGTGTSICIDCSDGTLNAKFGLIDVKTIAIIGDNGNVVYTTKSAKRDKIVEFFMNYDVAPEVDVVDFAQYE